MIVNQAHCIATGGSFDNGLPFSLSMGAAPGRQQFLRESRLPAFPQHHPHRAADRPRNASADALLGAYLAETGRNGAAFSLKP